MQTDTETQSVADAGRFTTPADERTLAETIAALEQRGFGVEVVDDLGAARGAVLGRIPSGASVITNTSVTLQETGIAAAINDTGRYDSARRRIMALDLATQRDEVRAIIGQADYALGSVHAVTRDGVLVLASATGSQLSTYAFRAPHVVLVAGTQKLVPDLETARERIVEHALPLESARTLAVYGVKSHIGKILEVHQEEPGRIHIVLVRQAVGY